MNYRQHGGYAFPCSTTDRMHDSGMSLHDWFAGMALQGLLANHKLHMTSESEIVIMAFNYADAMIRERDNERTE